MFFLWKRKESATGDETNERQEGEGGEEGARTGGTVSGTPWRMENRSKELGCGKVEVWNMEYGCWCRWYMRSLRRYRGKDDGL